MIESTDTSIAAIQKRQETRKDLIRRDLPFDDLRDVQDIDVLSAFVAETQHEWQARWDDQHAAWDRENEARHDAEDKLEAAEAAVRMEAVVTAFEALVDAGYFLHTKDGEVVGRDGFITAISLAINAAVDTPPDQAGVVPK